MSHAQGGEKRHSTASRNYAEVLLALARKAEETTGWGNMLRQIADAVEADATLRLFLESPRIAVAVKCDVLAKALGDRVPRLMLRYLQSLVKNRRQMLLSAISAEYDALVDETEGRVHARVTVSREVPDAERDSIAASLSKTLGQTVVPHMVVDPTILGGIIVRVGDTVMDGSVRRKLSLLQRRMVTGKAR